MSHIAKLEFLKAHPPARKQPPGILRHDPGEAASDAGVLREMAGTGADPVRCGQNFAIDARDERSGGTGDRKISSCGNAGVTPRRNSCTLPDDMIRSGITTGSGEPSSTTNICEAGDPEADTHRALRPARRSILRRRERRHRRFR
jgi:hypothetical protein